MAHQQFAGLAVLVALAFLALAISGCANPGHAAAVMSPELYDAGVGGDLRPG